MTDPKPPIVRVRRRLPFEWRCQDTEYTWHFDVDDVGWANTHTEAIALANDHVDRWHNPDTPTQVCGYPGLTGGTCGRHHGHSDNNHQAPDIYPDNYEGWMEPTTGLLGVHFDQYGRTITP